MKRNRQIKQMPGEGGLICSYEASEEVKKCPRMCHRPVFCEWGPWEVQDECSVTCGSGTKRQRRFMTGHKESIPTGNEEAVEKEADGKKEAH